MDELISLFNKLFLMKKKVLVGMSGGVDSAVTAFLLKEQGYDVSAGFMKNYVTDSPNCHTREDRDMAINVSQFLGIKTFIIFDFRQEYKEKIIQYIYHGYRNGFTPNPDVLCNNEIKFLLFLEHAKSLGFDYIAMGHYASIEKQHDGKYYLKQGIDPIKDQSYFLSRLNQYQLSHALLPLGGYMKSQVREIAHQIGLPNADRKDSQGLCFIGKVGMKEFLQKEIPVHQGKIFDTEGNVIGHHDGVEFYTIGQRHGLGSLNDKMYVIKKDSEKNILVVGPKDSSELFSDTLFVKKFHWISDIVPLPFVGKGKLRYRQELQDVEVFPETEHGHKITFSSQQQFVAPGQFFVLYDDQGYVIGSGEIE